MAHMQANYPMSSNINIPKLGIFRRSGFTLLLGVCSSRSYDLRISWKSTASGQTSVYVRRRIATTTTEIRDVTLHCRCSTNVSSSSSSSSSTSSPTSSSRELEAEGEGKCGELDLGGYLVRENGWKVRRMVEDEIETRKVAQVQAEAFHVPVLLFDDVFLQFFQAEVLSGLLYRLRNSPPDRYACLVAEPEPNTDDTTPKSQKELVGVVDVTVFRDEAVLQHLPGPGVEEYLYVSGIAVLNNFRRKKVATALLKACDRVCALWGYEYLVLRAYEDDLGALKLYGNAGYRIVSKDPPWMTSWIGRKCRVLMIKRPS